MIYESDCQLCGEDTEWAEPLMYNLPQNHPKRMWAWVTVCEECSEIYSPPLIFDAWRTVTLREVSCPFCNGDTINWVGTADWANPQSLLTEYLQLMEDADEKRLPKELCDQLLRVTAVCQECIQDKPDGELLQELERSTERVTLEDPMWEPVEQDDLEIRLDEVETTDSISEDTFEDTDSVE